MVSLIDMDQERLWNCQDQNQSSNPFVLANWAIIGSSPTVALVASASSRSIRRSSLTWATNWSCQHIHPNMASQHMVKYLNQQEINQLKMQPSREHSILESCHWAQTVLHRFYQTRYDSSRHHSSLDITSSYWLQCH